MVVDPGSGNETFLSGVKPDTEAAVDVVDIRTSCRTHENISSQITRSETSCDAHTLQWFLDSMDQLETVLSEVMGKPICELKLRRNGPKKSSKLSRSTQLSQNIAARPDQVTICSLCQVPLDMRPYLRGIASLAGKNCFGLLSCGHFAHENCFSQHVEQNTSVSLDEICYHCQSTDQSIEIHGDRLYSDEECSLLTSINAQHLSFLVAAIEQKYQSGGQLTSNMIKELLIIPTFLLLKIDVALDDGVNDQMRRPRDKKRSSNLLKIQTFFACKSILLLLSQIWYEIEQMDYSSRLDLPPERLLEDFSFQMFLKNLPADSALVELVEFLYAHHPLSFHSSSTQCQLQDYVSASSPDSAVDVGNNIISFNSSKPSRCRFALVASNPQYTRVEKSAPFKSMITKLMNTVHSIQGSSIQRLSSSSDADNELEKVQNDLLQSFNSFSAQIISDPVAFSQIRSFNDEISQPMAIIDQKSLIVRIQSSINHNWMLTLRNKQRKSDRTEASRPILHKLYISVADLVDVKKNTIRSWVNSLDNLDSLSLLNSQTSSAQTLQASASFPVLLFLNQSQFLVSEYLSVQRSSNPLIQKLTQSIPEVMASVNELQLGFHKSSLFKQCSNFDGSVFPLRDLAIFQELVRKLQISSEYMDNMLDLVGKLSSASTKLDSLHGEFLNQSKFISRLQKCTSLVSSLIGGSVTEGMVRVGEVPISTLLSVGLLHSLLLKHTRQINANITVTGKEVVEKMSSFLRYGSMFNFLHMRDAVHSKICFLQSRLQVDSPQLSSPEQFVSSTFNDMPLNLAYISCRTLFIEEIVKVFFNHRAQRASEMDCDKMQAYLSHLDKVLYLPESEVVEYFSSFSSQIEYNTFTKFVSAQEAECQSKLSSVNHLIAILQFAAIRISLTNCHQPLNMKHDSKDLATEEENDHMYPLQPLPGLFCSSKDFVSMTSSFLQRVPNTFFDIPPFLQNEKIKSIQNSDNAGETHSAVEFCSFILSFYSFFPRIQSLFCRQNRSSSLGSQVINSFLDISLDASQHGDEIRKCFQFFRDSLTLTGDQSKLQVLSIQNHFNRNQVSEEGEIMFSLGRPHESWKLTNFIADHDHDCDHEDLDVSLKKTNYIICDDITLDISILHAKKLHLEDVLRRTQTVLNCIQHSSIGNSQDRYFDSQSSLSAPKERPDLWTFISPNPISNKMTLKMMKSQSSIGSFDAESIHMSSGSNDMTVIEKLITKDFSQRSNGKWVLQYQNVVLSLSMLIQSACSTLFQKKDIIPSLVEERFHLGEKIMSHFLFAGCYPLPQNFAMKACPSSSNFRFLTRLEDQWPAFFAKISPYELREVLQSYMMIITQIQKDVAKAIQTTNASELYKAKDRWKTHQSPHPRTPFSTQSHIMVDDLEERSSQKRRKTGSVTQSLIQHSQHEPTDNFMFSPLHKLTRSREKDRDMRREDKETEHQLVKLQKEIVVLDKENDASTVSLVQMQENRRRILSPLLEKRSDINAAIEAIQNRLARKPQQTLLKPTRLENIPPKASVQNRTFLSSFARRENASNGSIFNHAKGFQLKNLKKSGFK